MEAPLQRILRIGKVSVGLIGLGVRVTRTPALLVNGVVKCAGRLPSRSQIEEWLREARG